MNKCIPFLVFLVLLSSCAEKEKSPEFQQSILRGQVVYEDLCATCHRPDGLGVEGAFPPLAHADYLFENIEASIHGIKYGQQGEIVVNGNTYNGVMAAQGLTDQEVADVMNYILNTWENNHDVMITEAQVQAIQP